MSQSVAQRLFFLQLAQKIFGKRRLIGVSRNIVTSVAGQGNQTRSFAPVLQALAIASLHQPLGQGARLAQLGQIGKQVKTYRLKNVGGLVIHAELDGDGVNQILVLVDERSPGLLAAFAAFGHQAFIRPIGVPLGL